MPRAHPHGFHRSFWQVIALLGAAIFIVAMGDTLMRAALERSAPAPPGSAGGILGELSRLGGDWMLFVGVFLHILFFALYAVALSWAPLSFAEPLSGASYIVVVFLARYYLNENIPTLRWIGSFLVFAGIVFIGRSAHGTAPLLADPDGESAPAEGQPADPRCSGLTGLPAAHRPQRPRHGPAPRRPR